jgi:hypothetical protein
LGGQLLGPRRLYLLGREGLGVFVTEALAKVVEEGGHLLVLEMGEAGHYAVIGGRSHLKGTLQAVDRYPNQVRAPLGALEEGLQARKGGEGPRHPLA